MTTFKKGEEVFLSLHNHIVGSGVVQKVRPDDTCQRSTIGEGRISVLVDQALDTHCNLPIPCLNARTLGEAVDSCIIWDIADVSRKTDVSNMANILVTDELPLNSDGIADSQEKSLPKSNEEVEDENGGQSRFPMNEVTLDQLSNSKSAKGKEKVGNRDYSLRSIWYNEPVKIFCPERVSIIGGGVIIVSDSTTHVNNEPLGMNHVGISLENIGRAEYFPNIDPTVLRPPLIRWPIHCVKLINDERFLGDIVSERVVVVEDENHHYHDQGQSSVSPTLLHGDDVNQLRPTSYDGVDGDEVALLLFGVTVAKGIVFKVHPLETCHNVAIGEGNISVRIVEVIEGFETEDLKYPHDGADTLGESINTIIKWPVIDVRKVGSNGEMPPDEDEEFEAGASDDAPLESTKEKDQVASKDYTMRSNWYKEHVEVFCLERVSMVATGIIMVSATIGAVNNEALGETHVGVTLAEILRNEHFPSIEDGLAPLVRWPIHSVKLISNGRFLGDIVSEEILETNDAAQVLKCPTPVKKRAYHSTKRKRIDPEVKKQKQLATKAAKKITEESIDDVRRQKCCGMKCCLTMPREDIANCRREFHGMDTVGKASYIYSLFLNREQEVIDDGRMILKAMVVCKPAFYIIHAFSRSKFYDYEADYYFGGKVGYHGNKASRKTRPNTLTAYAILERILKQSGEPMPHITYNDKYGTDSIEYRLPSCFSKTSIWREVNDGMQTEGFCPIGFSTFHRMWNSKFANFKLHKNSAFSKCDDCTQFTVELRGERRTEQRQKIEAHRTTHLNQQMSMRHVYYSAREMAKQQPEKYLCIIHDKMDQSKTWLPKLVPIPKSLSTGGHNLPVALTGMLTHGRLPGAYAHFSLTGLWPGDADFTVTSLAKCFKDLEEFDGLDKSGDLSLELARSTIKPIFKAVMDPEAFQASYLHPNNRDINRYKGRVEKEQESTDFPSAIPEGGPTREGNEGSSSSTPFKPLPPILVLQMDNSGKDNKNQYIMAYLSDLVARGHFKEIILSFLMPGHTHEDIDALFSRVSVRTRGIGISTLLALMAEVWECEAIHPVPRLISEVAAYKDYLKSGDMPPISGQSQPVAFRFSMRNNVPIYQYRANINSAWIPVEGRCLWNKDPVSNELMLPHDEPLAKKMDRYYSDAHEVVPFIRRYVQNISKSCKDETSVAYREMHPLIKHWETIANVLEGEVGDHGPDRPMSLSNGFWPKTNHGTGYKTVAESSRPQANPNEDEHVNRDMAELQAELNEEIGEREEMFVGHRSEKERERWNPLLDIQEGKFIILNPNDDWEKMHGKGLIWLVRAMSCVDPNHLSYDGHHAMFKIEWWRPKHVHSKVKDQVRYSKCLSPKTVWERDPGYLADGEEIWQLASSAIFGFKTRVKEPNISEKGLSIPKKTCDTVKEVIDRL